jgi:hypothetical protein
MTYLIKSEPKNVKFARVYYSTTNDAYTFPNGGSTQIRLDTLSGDPSVAATVSNNSIITGDKRYIIITKPCQTDAATGNTKVQVKYYWKLNGTIVSAQVICVNPGYSSGATHIGSVPVGFIEIEAALGDTLTLHADSLFVSQPVTLPWNSFGVFIMEIDK